MDEKCLTGMEVSFPDAEIERLKRRIWILSYAPKQAVGAEIGVFRGHFSEHILRVTEPSKLYLVDPWRLLGEKFNWREPNSEYLGWGKLTTEYALEDTKRRIEPYREKSQVIVVEDYCEQFLNSVDEELDFVYLDTTHAYLSTLNELKLIDRVLSSRGIILGDDWWPNPQSVHHGVFHAVNDFVKSHDYQVVACGIGNQWCLRRNPIY